MEAHGRAPWHPLAVATIETDDGIELWFTRTGPARGLPLVLCHGGAGLWDNLAPLAALIDGDRPVIRWDQRGCGRSTGAAGPFTVARFVADLEALRETLGFDRWIVGGHSWGGATLALRYAMSHTHATAGLLYLSGTGLGRGWHPAYKAAPAERLTAEQLDRVQHLEALGERRTRAQEVEWRTLRWAPDFADRHRALELAAIDAEAPFNLNLECNAAINAETKSWDEATFTRESTEVRSPALLLHGAQDPRPPSAIAGLARALPNASVHVIDDVGHSPWLERPGAVASILRKWLHALG